MKIWLNNVEKMEKHNEQYYQVQSSYHHEKTFYSSREKLGTYRA